MGVETTRYVRKPLYVEAVRVTPQNIEELAEWCDGKIDMGFPNPHGTGKKKKYIKVNVLNPRNPRQTMAFIGDWLLRQGDSFKIYTFKAFEMAFDRADETDKSDTQTTFYIDPDSGDLTEEKPGKHAQPLTAAELEDIVRNELVVTYVNSNVVKEEPLPPQPQNVGGDIEIQDRRDKEIKDPEIREVSVVSEDPDPANGVFPIESVEPATGTTQPPDALPPEPEESPEMQEARETIEADGGTVEPATPQGIAQAVKENEQARAATELAEEGIAEVLEGQQPEKETPYQETDDQFQGQGHEGETPIPVEPVTDGVAVQSSPTSPPVEPPEVAPEPQPVLVSEQEVLASGKRILTEHEQRILGPDEVRAMIRAGDVVLAQDLAPTEQA